MLPTLLFLALASGSAWGQRGAVSVHRDLAALTGQAELIVRGTVLSARVEPHPQYSSLHTVVVTLHVDAALKGRPAKTHTFRQLIWDIRDRRDAAGYRKGEQVLLLLNLPSELGLTSPAGAEQGRFRIDTDAAGRRLAVNGRGNAGLFKGLAAHAQQEGIALRPAAASLIGTHRRGPVSLERLEEIILALRSGS